jgi:aristolochene synthase
MRFAMELRLSSEELERMRTLERNCSKHISVVNDIFSWEKECKAAETGNIEGSVLCSAVQVLMEETSLNVLATKRVLWQMVREWEAVHDQLVVDSSAVPGCTETERQYMKGLEFQMSGNELWSRTTPRYSNV